MSRPRFGDIPLCYVIMFMYDYPEWGFSVIFPQLYGKCQGKTRKDGARPALFLIFLCSMHFLCFSMYFCAVLCIVCFMSFSVLFVCICVLYYCQREAIQLQLNISYLISTVTFTSLNNENKKEGKEGRQNLNRHLEFCTADTCRQHGSTQRIWGTK
jgi:hypothetical protein